MEWVHEIHLAGHTVKQFEDSEILIDTHNQCVTNDVWCLYESAARRFIQVPVLIDWDSDIPELDVLLGEAGKAEQILQSIADGEKREYTA